MFLVRGWGAGTSAVGAMSFGDAAEGRKGIESSSHNHRSISAGPVNYGIMLFWFRGVEPDRKLGVVVRSWW